MRHPTAHSASRVRRLVPLMLAALVAGVLCVGGGALIRLIWLPLPSAEAMEHAIRYAPGNGGPGVGDDGRRYEIVAAQWGVVRGVGDPQVPIWVTVWGADGRQVDAGLLPIILVAHTEPTHVVIGTMELHGCDELSEPLLASFAQRQREAAERLIADHCPQGAGGGE